jgi:hypothetical protein
VDFETRHNLSTRQDPNKGIGAAVNGSSGRLLLIYASEGRLTVERSFYTVGGPGTRLEREIVLTNIMAYSGHRIPRDRSAAHYDSRVNDNNDSTSFAPGANDNGSGQPALWKVYGYCPHKNPFRQLYGFILSERNMVCWAQLQWLKLAGPKAGTFAG